MFSYFFLFGFFSCRMIFNYRGDSKYRCQSLIEFSLYHMKATYSRSVDREFPQFLFVWESFPSLLKDNFSDCRSPDWCFFKSFNTNQSTPLSSFLYGFWQDLLIPSFITLYCWSAEYKVLNVKNMLRFC